ncbi:MAG: glycosyltransferase family 4 protein [Bacteroidales bacterium]|nr:glycosyltransferase family 4 protein [Bacteroidales bacterium]
MRIGYDAKRAFNNHRGLGNYSRETIRILASHFPDLQLDLFTPKIDTSIRFDCPQNATIIQPKSTFLHSLWRTFGISKEAEKRGLDLYHGLSHELPYGIEKTRIPTVVTMHDLIFVRHPELYPFFDRKSYKAKYLRSCRMANRIIAVSQQTKNDLIELWHIEAERISVVYQGCHPAFCQQVTDSQKQAVRNKYNLPETFLLNVGAIEPRKNQLLILKALVAGAIDTPLVIVGRKTDYITELQQYINKHKLQNQVTILPNVDFADLPALYQSASIFIYPSQYEGFGIPVVEALQSCVPVIAAKGSCLEESGGPGSRYVSPDDAEELAEQITAILQNNELRNSMIVQGKTYASQFSDNAIANHLMQIYTELTGLK